MPQYYNTSIKNLSYKLRKFEDILKEELTDEILKHEKVIIDMVCNQLYEGLDGYYLEIRPPYAVSTIKRKIKKGQPTDRVVLRDTGEFYESLYVAHDSDGFFIASHKEELSNILRKKYGKPILRLSNENLSELLRDYIRPSLIAKMKNYLRNG